MDNYKELLNNCLFRYRPYNENTISALKADRLYFSIPAYFNDPNDCYLFPAVDSILNQVDYELKHYMESYIALSMWKNPLASAAAKTVWYSENRDTHIMRFMENVKNTIIQISKNMRYNVKAICFSQCYDSILMWSHYTDSHKGFILAYEKDSIEKADRYGDNDIMIENKTVLRPITYTDTITDITKEMESYYKYLIIQINHGFDVNKSFLPQKPLRELLFMKSSVWSYEQEWRLTCRIIDLINASPLNYINCKPKAIIARLNCESENKKELYDISKMLKVPLLQMQRNPHTPNLELVLSEYL